MSTRTEDEIADIVATIGRTSADGLLAESSLADLGLDSVTMVEIVFAIEERFDIAIPLETETASLTLGDLAGLVEKLRVPAP